MSTSEWARGLLPYAVLALLRRHRSHGYALIEQLEAAGVGSFKGGTVYPLLQRLEEQGLVGFEWEHPGSGPARKVFFLTDQGTQHCDELDAEWASFSTTIDSLRNTR